jgi:hypothetical protein
MSTNPTDVQVIDFVTEEISKRMTKYGLSLSTLSEFTLTKVNTIGLTEAQIPSVIEHFGKQRINCCLKLDGDSFSVILTNT